MYFQWIHIGSWTNWSDWSNKETATTCFFVAFFVRLLVLPVSITTGLNPYAQADAIGFATAAEQIASLIANGTIFIEGMSAMDQVSGSPTYHRWGLLLAPFWLLPGPSLVYATLGVATLGAGAVYNVARITDEIATRRAALFAAAPITFYPSFIFVHTTLLREAAVLFCVSMITMLIITCTLQPIIRFLVSVLLTLIILALRPEFAALIALAIMTGFGLWSVAKLTRSVAVVIRIITVTALGGVAVIPYISPLRSELLGLRRGRFYGRTRYVELVPLETATDSLIWGGLMGFYFLFSPFPWMIENIMDSIIFLESIMSLMLTFCFIYGISPSIKKHPAVVGGLLIALLIGIVIFGLGTANVGTAVRHRQMFLWILFLIGGIGLDYRFGTSIDRLLRHIR